MGVREIQLLETLQVSLELFGAFFVERAVDDENLDGFLCQQAGDDEAVAAVVAGAAEEVDAA